MVNKNYLPEDVLTEPADHLRYGQSPEKGKLSIWTYEPMKNIDTDLGLILKINHTFTLGIEYTTLDDDFFVARLFLFRQHIQHQAYPISRVCSKHKDSVDPALKNFPLQLDDSLEKEKDLGNRYMPYMHEAELNPQPNILCPLHMDTSKPHLHKTSVDLKFICMDYCMETEHQHKINQRSYSDINLMVVIETLHDFKRVKTLDIKIHAYDTHIKAKNKRRNQNPAANTAEATQQMTTYQRIHDGRISLYSKTETYDWLTFLNTEIEAHSYFPYRMQYIHLEALKPPARSANKFLKAYKHHTLFNHVIKRKRQKFRLPIGKACSPREKNSLKRMKLLPPSTKKRRSDTTQDSSDSESATTTLSSEKDDHKSSNSVKKSFDRIPKSSRILRSTSKSSTTQSAYSSGSSSSSLEKQHTLTVKNSRKFAKQNSSSPEPSQSFQPTVNLTPFKISQADATSQNTQSFGKVLNLDPAVWPELFPNNPNSMQVESEISACQSVSTINQDQTNHDQNRPAELTSLPSNSQWSPTPFSQSKTNLTPQSDQAQVNFSEILNQPIQIPDQEQLQDVNTQQSQNSESWDPPIFTIQDLTDLDDLIKFLQE